MKVRTKVTEHEARQYTGTEEDKLAVIQWCGGRKQAHNPPHMIIETRDGQTRVVQDGFWIIEYPDGFEVCNAWDFAKTYEMI